MYAFHCGIICVLSLKNIKIAESCHPSSSTMTGIHEYFIIYFTCFITIYPLSPTDMKSPIYWHQ